jgi:hypothetical protein
MNTSQKSQRRCVSTNVQRSHGYCEFSVFSLRLLLLLRHVTTFCSSCCGHMHACVTSTMYCDGMLTCAQQPLVHTECRRHSQPLKTQPFGASFARGPRGGTTEAWQCTAIDDTTKLSPKALASAASTLQTTDKPP